MRCRWDTQVVSTGSAGSAVVQVLSGLLERTIVLPTERQQGKRIEANADSHAANVLPIIREIQRAGTTSPRVIAAALNARGVATARGGRWQAMTARNLLS
jgi:hypothetical protein